MHINRYGQPLNNTMQPWVGPTVPLPVPDYVPRSKPIRKARKVKG